MNSNFATKVDEKTGLPYLAVRKRGRDLLLDPLTNKGTGFPLAERDALGLHGFLPPKICDLDEQLARAYENNRGAKTPLQRCEMSTYLDADRGMIDSRRQVRPSVLVAFTESLSNGSSLLDD